MCVTSLIWAQKIEEAIMDSYFSLKKYLKVIYSQLEEVVTNVRGNLTDTQRNILGTQIIMEVHQKDIVEELLTQGITDPMAFEW